VIGGGRQWEMLHDSALGDIYICVYMYHCCNLLGMRVNVTKRHISNPNMRVQEWTSGSDVWDEGPQSWTPLGTCTDTEGIFIRIITASSSALLLHYFKNKTMKKYCIMSRVEQRSRCDGYATSLEMGRARSVM
jgi:hypothetical protein